MGLLRNLTTKLYRTGRTLGACATLALPLAGCLGYDGDVQHGYVMDEAALAKLKNGAAAEQVLVTLGTPSTTSTVGGDAWYYISQKTSQSVAFAQPTVVDQHVYAIYFTKAKKVERVANYGLDDGKVVDFASRTTPTSGKESNFIRNMFTNLLRFN